MKYSVIHSLPHTYCVFNSNYIMSFVSQGENEVGDEKDMIEKVGRFEDEREYDRG